MYCDLDAGIGTPRPIFGNGTVEIPKSSCTYHFSWNSMYACRKFFFFFSNLLIFNSISFLTFFILLKFNLISHFSQK